MDICVDPPRYFRDASGAVLSLGAVSDATRGPECRIFLELHGLGRLGWRLQYRSIRSQVAQVTATVGIADDLRASFFCRVWIRNGTPREMTVEFLLGELLQRMQRWLGRREIFGEVVVCCGNTSPHASVPRFSFGVRVDFDRSRHYKIPRMSEIDASNWEFVPYVEVPNPEQHVLAGSTADGDAKDAPSNSS
jgi:hypothetical protein